MPIRSTLFTATLLLATGVAHAEGVKPMQAQSIDLGDVSGSAYYTVEDDGFRVVTTLAQETGTPVRSVAILDPGQSVLLSTPLEVGVAPSKSRSSVRPTLCSFSPAAASKSPLAAATPPNDDSALSPSSDRHERGFRTHVAKGKAAERGF